MLHEPQKSAEAFRAEFHAIPPGTRLSRLRLLPLLKELAGAPPNDERTTQQLYKAAALRWHPDVGGDAEVFLLLQLARSEARRRGL
ncbi:hypothetical protein ACWGK1_00300 [Streptomyces wedmorensis]